MSISRPKCIACFRILEVPERFPEDFPNEWKICCFCLEIAKNLINKHLVKLIEFYKTGYAVNNKFVERVMRIYDLITLKAV